MSLFMENSSYDFMLNESAIESANQSFTELPTDHERSLPVLVVYCILFVIAAIGNLTVFIRLFKSRRRKSRISLMIRHLAIADLIVTFIMIPVEVGWRLTVQWLAGNVACKVFLYLRAFGLYLSSNVLVCVSLDRYFAVLHPFKVNDARRRGKYMLIAAWIISMICALPQSVVFHVASHPTIPNFTQCVTFGFFTSEIQQITYNLFGVVVMYFVPLLVIIVAYTAILCEISRNSSETREEPFQASNGRMRLRRSDISNIERARTRTLRMTVTIVVVFIICWTPYVVVTLWYTFDRKSAEQLPSWLQDTLFMMAVSNSCMNPLVYGSYAINIKRQFLKYLCCFRYSSRNNLPDGENVLAVRQGLGCCLKECFISLKKGSRTTRSTGMLHAIGNNRSPNIRPNHLRIGVLPKINEPSFSRPPNAGHVGFLSEPVVGRGYRSSFHSDPCKFEYNAPEPSQHSRSPKMNVSPL